MPAELPQALAQAAGLELGRYRQAHVHERVRRAIEREQVTGVGGLARRLQTTPARVSGFDARSPSPSPGSSAIPSSSSCSSASCCRRSSHAVGKRESGRPGAPTGPSCTRSPWCSSAQARSSARSSSAATCSRRTSRRRAPAPGSARTLRPRSAGGCRWEQRDLLRDGPAPGKWHVILCRNVAIYFAYEAKDRLHAQLASSLACGGVLLLGRSERVSNAGPLRARGRRPARLPEARMKIGIRRPPACDERRPRAHRRGRLCVQLATIGQLRHPAARANHSTDVVESSAALDRVLINLLDESARLRDHASRRASSSPGGRRLRRSPRRARSSSSS